MEKEDPSELRQRIGRRLSEARRDADLRQEDVRDRLGMSLRSQTDWESGKATPPADKLCRLALLFGVSTDYILGLTDNRSGLPVGKWIVDVRGVERAERATRLEQVQEFHQEEGWLFGFEVPEGSEVLASKAYRQMEERIKRLEKRLSEMEGNEDEDPDGTRNRDERTA